MYIKTENKETDRLCSNCTTDLRLCFRICKTSGFPIATGQVTQRYHSLESPISPFISVMQPDFLQRIEATYDARQVRRETLSIGKWFVAVGCSLIDNVLLNFVAQSIWLTISASIRHMSWDVTLICVVKIFGYIMGIQSGTLQVT